MLDTKWESLPPTVLKLYSFAIDAAFVFSSLLEPPLDDSIAIILSKAGVDSLNLKQHVSQEFSVNDIIPSIGQGIIAIQCRADDLEMIELLKKVNHETTNICATAEREVLKILEGDCNTAIGAFSFIEEQNLNLVAELFSIDGKKRYYCSLINKINFAKQLGEEVGNILKKNLKEITKDNYAYIVN